MRPCRFRCRNENVARCLPVMSRNPFCCEGGGKSAAQLEAGRDDAVRNHGAVRHVSLGSPGQTDPALFFRLSRCLVSHANSLSFREFCSDLAVDRGGRWSNINVLLVQLFPRPTV